MNEVFRRFAQGLSVAVGSPAAFFTALVVIVLWAVSGPLFGYSDTWQLVINTSTTIITFLMVFVIQNSQNRDARAIHLKLDELLRADGSARTSLVNLESLPDDRLMALQEEFERLQDEYGIETAHVHHIEEELNARKPKGKEVARP